MVVGRSTAVTLISNDSRYGSALDHVKRRTAPTPFASPFLSSITACT